MGRVLSRIRDDGFAAAAKYGPLALAAAGAAAILAAVGGALRPAERLESALGGPALAARAGCPAGEVGASPAAGADTAPWSAALLRSLAVGLAAATASTGYGRAAGLLARARTRRRLHE